MPISDCVIIGAGGHAKVVLDAYLRCYPNALVELRDDAVLKCGMSVLGASVVAPVGPVARLRGPCHVAIGDNARRRSFGVAVIEAGLMLLAIVHPRAEVSAHASIDQGVFVAAGAIVAAGANIGAGVIVNHGAIVDHDCAVGAWSHIAPNSVLGGAVKIGAGCLIGSGAVILPGVCIGDEAAIGAGAVVTRNVGAGVTVVGVPAREPNDKR
jgi:sugar O-acyltransferase (sialic acid O-acetyltransferase NeuD family)